MKNMIWKSIALCAIGFATLTGCNKPEQSEFNVNDITTTATIKGQVYYETGDIAAPTANLPAGTKIFIDVPYSSYTSSSVSGSSVPGTKTFETTADATGNFSIAIPCPIGGLNNVVVRVQDFAGEKIINGVKEKGIFKGGNISTTISVMPSDIYTVGAGFSTAIDNLEFNKLPELVKITVYGYISRPVMKFDNNTVDIISRRDSAISDSVLVTVLSSKYGSQSYRVKASNGRFECDVLIGKTGDMGSITADAIASAPTTFTHRATSSTDPYNNKVLEVKGYYSKNTLSAGSEILKIYSTADADATVIDKKIPGVIEMQFNAYSEQEFASGLSFADYTWSTSSGSSYIIE